MKVREDGGPGAAAHRDVTAMVLEGPRSLRRCELPMPDTGDSDGLLRIEACGLCGTDHEQYTGDLRADFPFVPGHEAVGVVERVGTKAAARWGVHAGDRIAVAVFQSCRECERCLSGDARRCRRHGISDMYGFTAASEPPGLWGGYAGYQYLSPDSVVMRVPEGIDPVTATLFNPLGAGIRWAVSLPGTRPGDAVAILGPGIRGISALVAAREAGAGFVMVTGHGERDASRLDWARRFGADLTVDSAEVDPSKAFREAAGRAPDLVVDVTAKAPDVLGQAVRMVRPGGTIVLAGTRGSVETPGFVPDKVVLKEIRILGALGVDAEDYAEALAVLASGRYPWHELPREVVGFGGIEELLLAMAGESGRVPPLHGVLVPDTTGGRTSS